MMMTMMLMTMMMMTMMMMTVMMMTMIKMTTSLRAAAWSSESQAMARNTLRRV